MPKRRKETLIDLTYKLGLRGESSRGGAMAAPPARSGEGTAQAATGEAGWAGAGRGAGAGPRRAPRRQLVLQSLESCEAVAVSCRVKVSQAGGGMGSFK